MKKPKQLAAPSTQNTPVKQVDNKQLQTYTPEKVREIVLGGRVVKGDINYSLKRLGQELLPRYLHGTPKEKRKVEKEANEVMSEVFYGLETETQVTLMEGFDERHRGGVKQICRQFIEDFDCKTNAEKVLAETAAIAFGRYLDGSRRYNNCFVANEHINPNLTAYFSMLSKERDRAHRQYLSTIMTLKQLKAPTIEMNIKTNTAFVSQNQQFNAPQAPSENNESK